MLRASKSKSGILPYDEVIRIPTLARVSLIALALGALVLAGSFTPGTAQAKWKPAPARIDKNFGSGGWARVSIPRGTEVDAWNRTFVASAADGYFITAAVESTKTGKASGGMVMKLSSRGRPVRSFGNRGTLRVASPLQPEKLIHLSDRSLVLMSIVGDRETTDHDVVFTRYRRDGSQVKSFGQDGELKFESGDLDATKRRVEFIKQLHGERLAIVLSDSGGQGNSELLVYSKNGTLDSKFAGSGRLNFPFVVDSLTTTGRDEVLLSGPAAGASLQVARLARNGSVERSWGSAGTVTLPSPGALDVVNTQVEAVGDRALLTYETVSGQYGDFDSHDWGQRLTSRGAVDRTWGSSGRIDLGVDATSTESTGGGTSTTSSPMRDGRILTNFRDSDDFGDYQYFELKTRGRTGKVHARGSTLFTLEGLRKKAYSEYAHAIDRAARFYFSVGERNDRLIATRIRI